LQEVYIGDRYFPANAIPTHEKYEFSINYQCRYVSGEQAKILFANRNMMIRHHGKTALL